MNSTKPFNLRFIETCERLSEKVAIRVVGDDSEVYTFGELLRQVRAVAYRLEQENVRFGDKVALIGENHPCWEIAYLGVLYRGAVCVPLDPHGEIETLTNFLENCEARLAFLSADEMEKFRQIEEKLGRHVPAVVWRAENPSNGFQKFEDWTSAEFPAEFAAKLPEMGDDDAALLMYTSGTTGTPKGVPLTHGNIVAELDGINEVLSITEKDRILSLLPLFHVYLQIVNLWTATTYGCEIVCPSPMGSGASSYARCETACGTKAWRGIWSKARSTSRLRIPFSCIRPISARRCALKRSALMPSAPTPPRCAAGRGW